MTSIIMPTTSFPTVPQMRPMNAPRPAAMLFAVGRPFHDSPMYAPANAPPAPPRTAIINGPKTGIGSPTINPTTLPTPAPSIARATARLLAPCFAAPAALAPNSRTSPATANPTSTATAAQVIPPPASTGINHANRAAEPGDDPVTGQSDECRQPPDATSEDQETSPDIVSPHAHASVSVIFERLFCSSVRPCGRGRGCSPGGRS